jgi:hypothetical protein
MKITLINCDSGGSIGTMDIQDGTTLAQVFQQKLPGRDPEDYLKRVNRQEASDQQVLQEGDRVSVSPAKIQGA